MLLSFCDSRQKHDRNWPPWSCAAFLPLWREDDGCWAEIAKVINSEPYSLLACSFSALCLEIWSGSNFYQSTVEPFLKRYPSL